MSYPAGITPVTGRIGKSVTAVDGAATGLVAVITPVITGVKRLTHTVTGDQISLAEQKHTVAAGDVLDFQVIPVDHANLIDGAGNLVTGWSYKVQMTQVISNKKSIQLDPVYWSPLAAQTGIIDVDLIPDGTVATPSLGNVPAVTSVVGETGEVTVADIVAALGSVLAAHQAPAYAGNRQGFFDAALGLYRPTPNGLQKARAKVSAALTKTGSFHVVVLGDSQSEGVDVTNPWPYVLRRALQKRLGYGGSGIRFPKVGWASGWTFNNATTGTSFETPTNYGVYPHTFAGSTVVKINTDASIDIKAPDEGYDYVELYFMAGGSGSTKVQRNGVADAANRWLVPGYPGQTAASAGWTTLATEAGYMKGSNPAAQGGQIVVKITPTTPLPSDVFKIMAGFNGLQPAYFAGIEFRKNNSAGGARVTNFAFTGRTLQEVVGGFPNGNVDNATGKSGMAVAVDMPRADLYLVALSGTNDWNSANSTDPTLTAVYSGPAVYKTRLTALVNRIRATTMQGTNANSTPAAADVMFVAFPEPDYGWYAADHANLNNPTYVSYLKAMYEVSDELGVPVIDLAFRWPDHARALALGIKADHVHPTAVLGGNDYGDTVYTGTAAALAIGPT